MLMSKCKSIVEDLHHAHCFPCRRQWNPDVEDLPCISGKSFSEVDDGQIDAYAEYMSTIEELREEEDERNV